MRYQVQVIDSTPTYHLIDLQSETPEKRLVLESRDKAEIDWLLEGLEKIFELASKARLEKFGQTWKKRSNFNQEKHEVVLVADHDTRPLQRKASIVRMTQEGQQRGSTPPCQPFFRSILKKAFRELVDFFNFWSIIRP